MKQRIRFRWIYVVYICALVAVVLLTGFTVNHIKLKNFLEKDMHYEAWDLVYTHPYTFALTKIAKDDGVLFFDTMARHTIDSKNELADTWTLPDFTGWSCAEVACALRNINQAYEVEFIDAEKMLHNTVVNQEPMPNTTVAKDDIVTLYANSAYGGEIIAHNVPAKLSTIAQSGEWLIFSFENCIYRCHADFSDIELIYISDIDDRENSELPILANKDTVYFIESTNDEDLISNSIVSLSIDTGSKKTLYEQGEDMVITHYYDKGLYVLQDRYSSMVFNLETREYMECDVTQSVIYNDNVYWFQEYEKEDGYYESKLYMREYNNPIEPEQILVDIECRILYILPYNDFIFLGCIANDAEEIVYSYNINTKQLNILSDGTYSNRHIFIEPQCIIFNDYLYVISSNNYDYKYDLETMEQIPITIVSLDNKHMDSLGGKRIIGNSLLPYWISEYYNFGYNILTGEHEEIEILSEIDKID